MSVHRDDHETAESLELLGRIRKALAGSLATVHLVPELDALIERIEFPLPPAAERGIWWFHRAVEQALGEEEYKLEAATPVGPGQWHVSFYVRGDPEGVLFHRALCVTPTGTFAHTQAAAYRLLVKGLWKPNTATRPLVRALDRAARARARATVPATQCDAAAIHQLAPQGGSVCGTDGMVVGILQRTLVTCPECKKRGLVVAPTAPHCALCGSTDIVDVAQIPARAGLSAATIEDCRSHGETHYCRNCGVIMGPNNLPGIPGPL